MEKKRVEVMINGQSHAFVTSDGEEYIRGLADYLNEKIAEVANTAYGNLLSSEKKYVIASMNILDDYYKILSKYEQLSNNGDDKKSSHKSKAETEHNIEDFIAQINALKKENATLKDKLSNAEYELEYVQNLYEELKQEYEQKS